MKKTTTVLLCIAMLTLTLAGCGEAGAGISAGVSSEAAPASQPPVTEPATAESMGQEPEVEEAEDGEDGELPAYEWEFALPENYNMSSELLSEFHSVLEGTQINSAVTVKDGYIIDEFYQEGFDETSVFRFNSCSKSFTSALIGIAIDEGLIEGVDVPISEYFPQVEGTAKEAITIRHLLEHTSGIQWYEFTDATSFWEMNNSDNWVEYVLEQPMVAPPGSTFNYTTGGTHLLAAILEQATEETMLEYAQEHLFTPLGIDSIHWRADPQGVLDGGNGVEMTARDAAKFGWLFLKGGNWDGRQLVPESWVEESTAVQVSRSGNYGSYGYQWWIRRFGAYDTYYAMGAMGQFIVIVPELNLVTVVNSASSGDTAAPYPYISDYILAAYVPDGQLGE